MAEGKKTQSLQRESTRVRVAKNDTSPVKLPHSTLLAQSTFLKPREIQSRLLSETKAKAFFSSSQVNKLLSLRWDLFYFTDGQELK